METLATRFIGLVLVITGIIILIQSGGSSAIGAFITTIGLVETAFGFIYSGFMWLVKKIS